MVLPNHRQWKRPVGATFALHIIHVVLVGAKKKVEWVAARSIITFMENKKSIWDWAFIKHVRYSVGGMISSFKLNLSVTGLFVHTQQPRPTRIRTGYANIGPKNISWLRLVLPAFNSTFKSGIDVRLVTSHLPILSITSIAVK
jgi:hypothetical protein